MKMGQYHSTATNRFINCIRIRTVLFAVIKDIDISTADQLARPAGTSIRGTMSEFLMSYHAYQQKGLYLRRQCRRHLCRQVTPLIPLDKIDITVRRLMMR